MIEQLSATTFIEQLSSGDVVEIGDSSDSNFKPHLYLPRWDKESGIALEFPLAGTLSPELKGNVIEVTKGDFKLRWYSVQDELGGYEFEIILGKKPPVNYIDLDFQTKNVKAYYQPALTPQDVAQGVDRPENIVDSLALYHPTKRNGIYRAGKIGHLYRPLATDALGRKQWGVLSIVSGKLRVWFDPIWLASASYPVTIDPTFGYTTIGATGYNTENIIRGGNATGAAGTATTITAALRETGAANTHLVKSALYLQSNSSLLSTTNQRQDIAYTATAWYDFTLSPSVSISAVGYIPVAWANGGTGELRIYGDAGTASLWTDAETYGTFPDPAIFVETTSVDLSIYVTYTAGGGLSIPVAMHHNKMMRR